MTERSRKVLFATLAAGWAVMVVPSTGFAQRGVDPPRGSFGANEFRGGEGVAGYGAGSRFYSGGYGNYGATPGNTITAYRGEGATWNGTPAAPATARFNNGNWRGWHRSFYNEFGGFYGGGAFLGPYWGFYDPYWYGGLPFWYAAVPMNEYTNPYNETPYASGGYNYSVPIQVSPEGPRDDASFSQARTDFIAGNYRQAELDIAQAIQQMPGNVDVHEFNALILFAMGDYDRAAAVAHTVLEAGPGWDWSILQTFYGSPDVYTAQLRALEHYVGDHASDPGARFLLTYQYLILGHVKAADHQLAAVVAMEPKDKLSANILAALNKAPGMTTETPATRPVAKPAGPPPTAAQLHGSWKASPMPGVTIETTLQPDGHFTWTGTEGGQTQTFTGSYSVQNDRLMFTRTDGNTMDGVISAEGTGFNFRLNNAPPNEPGLRFSKAGG